MEQARADQMRSQADQQAALAQAEQARTAAIIAEQNTAQLQVLADAAKPVYWPWVLVLLLVMGCGIFMGYIMMRSHVMQIAMLTNHDPQAVRLLPSAVSYSRLRQIAQRQGCELDVQGDSYYLIDDAGGRRKIKALIGDGS
jgi:hypothetical protein